MTTICGRLPELALLAVVAFGTALVGAQDQSLPAPELFAQAPLDDAALRDLLDELGDEDYQKRERATQRIIAAGPSVESAVAARASVEQDPEVLHRLRFILENVTPPEAAALVTRAMPRSGLTAGDLITHVNSRRVRSASEVREILSDSQSGAMLRVAGVGGRREIGPLRVFQVQEMCDYRAPRGEKIARAVRLYADGFAEQAYELLRGIADPIPENELSPLLHARIAYTAGDASTAVKLLPERDDLVVPRDSERSVWETPSLFDLVGPGKSPFHLDVLLYARGGPNTTRVSFDPDVRIQRLMVPARRRLDALLSAIENWHSGLREKLGHDDDGTAAGNMLAVAGWMLSELDLLSECCQVIKPRSAILKFTWVRVQTDAWFPFLAGDAKGALDGFYDDARSVLERPRDGFSSRLRNPLVASTIAFFLYQFPNDPRVAAMLELVNSPSQPALSRYLEWMLFALSSRNYDVVRDHAAKILPRLGDAGARLGARAVALLEYVRERPEAEVFVAARERMRATTEDPEREQWLAVIDALALLSAEKYTEAREALRPFEASPELSALHSTIQFLIDPPATAANHASLRAVRLAVPEGTDGRRWVVLSRDHRLMRFDTVAGTLVPIERPSATWFPGPFTWPWIGREESTGRVWVYDRRRVIELAEDPSIAPLRLSIDFESIADFHQQLSPFFSVLADAAARIERRGGENGEFLRAEIKANGEFVADPDLPEIALIRPLPEDPRLLYVALRGGPILLIDKQRRKAWTSVWIADKLGMQRPPVLFAQALRPVNAESPPVAMLMTDQGLLRFDPASETVTRVDLPGEAPHAAVIPEWTPYERRDPRFVYCARLPEEGGQVFRYHVADGRIEPLDMVNEALPEGYYAVRTRAELREMIDARLAERSLPTLSAFLDDAREAVEKWQKLEK